jgi:flavin-binding protein dodecin
VPAAKIAEINAESSEGFDAAVRSGIERARYLKNVRSLWVKRHDIAVAAEGSRHYRVTMRVTFLSED